jgi:DNA-binding CsgD family transcriptional regulator
VVIGKKSYLTGDAAFAMDRRGVIVSWNSEAEKMFNRPASEAVGQRCWKLMSGKDMYGNRYCCKRCPLMQMASDHESVHRFPISFRTGSNGYKKLTLNSLTVFAGNGDGLLLHICNEPDENPEYSDNNHAIPSNDHAQHRPSANNQRGALTNREHEVLELLADGKSTRKIASLMCISPATVRNHIQRTLYKLHVHTRLEAVVTAHHLDLV